MNQSHIYKRILFFSLIILSGISCQKNFLSVDPQGKKKDEQFFTSSKDAVEAVNSIYGHLNIWAECGFPLLAITSIPSDDADKGSSPGDSGFLDDYDNFTFTSSQAMIDVFWKGQYEGINLSNQCIENIPKIAMDEVLKNRLIAEAKFLRAYHYFNLVRAFGGVPKVDKIPVASEELNPSRASKEAIYTLIEQDLNDASALPISYSGTDVGRATHGAALAMLAKVKMYQNKWGEVLTLTNQVIPSYTLMDDYEQIFRVENNSESIFEVQTKQDVNCGLQDNYTNIQSVRGQWGWGFNTPSEDLAGSYEAGDVRKDGTILFKGETTPEGDKVSNLAPNPMYNQKAYQPTSIPKICGSDPKDQNRRILRLGDVLLMNAEAANELDQNALALQSLNKVRNRAKLGSVTINDKNLLRQAIWKERRAELAMEEDRFFDLVRQGRAGQVLRALGKQFVDGKNEVFPIPQAQIDLSGGKLVQNPGY
jgi:starch-binding outer membrane protein, SusD/RagB family